jgi:hypothetical protein
MCILSKDLIPRIFVEGIFEETQNPTPLSDRELQAVQKVIQVKRIANTAEAKKTTE